ncbi:MAG TPA: Nif3-like dinuclear metal center hexameric protein [Anaerolineae bacterium]
MLTARQIAEVFESIAPIETGIAGDELGFVFGDPQQEVRGVACMWIVTVQSITAAIASGANMIICHESIWMPSQLSPWYSGPSTESIYSNQQRKQLLERNSIVVYRSHSNWDALRDDGVPDQAIAALGIDGLRVVGRQRFFAVHELPEPHRMQWLFDQVRAGLGYDACRIHGDRERVVRRFAFLIGGFGENQFHMPQAARDMGAEAIIIGEMSEFIVIACLEMGLPVIETLHSISEMPAIHRQAQLLSARLKDVPVGFIPSGAAAM